MDETGKFNLFFQLQKVDEAKRLVYGRATAERPDVVREIMDYATSKPHFQQWSQQAEKRSGGKSKGNMREMHESIAAGKVVEINFDDLEKAIDIGTYCSNDSTWQKILDGTLTGFSIGGTAKRFPDRNPSFVRFTAFPNEISYVDAPALPEAQYTMIKADGTSELRKINVTLKKDLPNQLTNPDIQDNPAPDAATLDAPFGTVESDQERVLPIVADTPIAPGMPAAQEVPVAGQGTPPVDVAKFNQVIEKFTELLDRYAAVIEKSEDRQHAEAEQRQQSESMLKALGSRVGIARRDGEPLNPSDDYPTNPDDYADPANWSWPCDKQAHCQNALSNFNAGLGKSKYSDREWNVLGRRIAQRVGALYGAGYQYSPQKKQIERIAKVSKPMQKDALTSVVADLRSAAQSALDNISNPEAVMSALHQILAGIDVATDIDSTPSTPSGSSSGASTLEMATPTPSTGTMTPGASTVPSVTPSTSTTTSTPEYKTMVDKVDKLAELVEKMLATQKATPIQKTVTIGDLNAQVQPPDAASTPLEKAITSAAQRINDGIGPDHIQAIMQAAAGDAGRAQDTAMELARKSLAKKGYNSAAQTQVLDPALINTLLDALRAQAQN